MLCLTVCYTRERALPTPFYARSESLMPQTITCPACSSRWPGQRRGRNSAPCWSGGRATDCMSTSVQRNADNWRSRYENHHSPAHIAGRPGRNEPGQPARSGRRPDENRVAGHGPANPPARDRCPADHGDAGEASRHARLLRILR